MGGSSHRLFLARLWLFEDSRCLVKQSPVSRGSFGLLFADK